MLNKQEARVIEKTIEIIQREITVIFTEYGSNPLIGFHYLEGACSKIRVLIECRNRLQNYFINGLD